MSPFIKLDANGNHLDAAAADADVAAVLDPSTGLTWLARDLSDRRMTHADAEDAAASCTTLGLNWRLPDATELFNNVDRSRFNPAVNPDGLPNIKSDWYWTSEKLASSSVCAWVVNFLNGFDRNRSSDAFVRAVSGPAPAGQ
jgi:hypothetical protein